MRIYNSIQRFVSRYYMQFPSYRLLRKCQVIYYNYAYAFGIVEKSDIKGYTVWDLFEFINPADGEGEPFIHPLREYSTEQRAYIAFVALTDL